MQKIYPCVWIDQATGDVNDALAYYQNIFGENLKVLTRQNFGKAEDLPDFIKASAGKIMYVEAEIFGNRFMLLTGAPDVFPRSGFVSFIILTKDQAETDQLWDAITKEGRESVCGWCSDKFGVNWQVTPEILMEIQENGTEEEKTFANTAMFQMKKIIIKDLKK